MPRTSVTPTFTQTGPGHAFSGALTIGKLAMMILGATAIGCADHRAVRDDDEAMLVYRDCMNAMPQSSSNYRDSAALANHDNAAMNASMNSTVQAQREQREQMRCMQAAGRKEQ